MLWVNSVHYNLLPVRGSLGLFHKMSNEIIRPCFQSISLDRIFKGYVISSKQNLTN
ncbi:hypothetical protein ABVT39_014678, partial [Epinephelus coioides]